MKTSGENIKESASEFLLYGIAMLLFLFLRVPCRAENKKVSDFTLVSTTGEKLVLSKLKGKVVLMNFFASWCVPCKKEIPYLNVLQKKYPDELVLLGSDLEQKTASGVLKTAKSFSVSFAIFVDKEGALTEHYKIYGYPTTVLIDAEGFEVEVIHEALEGDVRTSFEKILEAVLEEGHALKTHKLFSVFPFEAIGKKAVSENLGDSLSEKAGQFLQSFSAVLVVSPSARHRYEIKGTVSKFVEGEAGVSVSLVDAKTGKTLATVSLSYTDGNSDAFFSALKKAFSDAKLLPIE